MLVPFLETRETWAPIIIADMMSVVTQIGLQLFFLVIVSVALRHGRLLFLDAHGWRHRLVGAAHLSWLVYGCLTIERQVVNDAPQQGYYCLFYDIVLGCLGLAATLTAARDFPHRHVRNGKGQSGTLSATAMVTQGEMQEHAFYQFLNLWQALYLHYFAAYSSTFWQHQWLALWCVTAPWYFRSRFPVHSFSKNWQKSKSNKSAGSGSDDRETLLLYRIKKGQYLFYKHVVLHGVNISICLQQSSLVMTRSWRIFWLCLNTAYAMEFFLQSLVRRKVLKQSSMLWLNRLLMAVSSLAAVPAIMLGGTTPVRWELCLASLLLNFYNRHHDVVNTVGLGSVALFLSRTTAW